MANIIAMMGVANDVPRRARRYSARRLPPARPLLRREVDLFTAARFDEHEMFPVDRSDADYALMGRRIERWCGRTIVAHHGDDQVAAAHQRLHHAFHQFVSRADQAHVDDGHMLTRHPAERRGDGIDGAAKSFTAVHIRREDLAHAMAADQQVRDRRAVRLGTTFPSQPL